jgi:transposase
MQQITDNMLFRWFVGLAMDVPVWDVTVFTKNRDRLLEGGIARGFLAAILADRRSCRCCRPSTVRWTAP